MPEPASPIRPEERGPIRTAGLALGTLAAVVALIGMDWGLPARETDEFLFSGPEVWSADRLLALKEHGWQDRDRLGADVDPDPVERRDETISLTATDAERAEILIRYRLYTHQPDEASTLRALAGMNPRELRFDPKLYQYGGLFLYPVGALIAIGSALGLVEARTDLAYYVAHPEAFGTLYVVARLYAGSFLVVGVLTCLAIGRRLVSDLAGVLGGLLFLLMPVAVTMAHEAKPHLPGAVLMLVAGWAALRYVERGTGRSWAWLSLAAGAAAGMVLSCWLVGTILLVTIWLRPATSRAATARRLLLGIGGALLVFALTNPYLLINLVATPEVVRSNLGTSRGMYEIGRFGEGALNVARLLVEGMGLPLALIGLLALCALIRQRGRMLLPLLVPAVLTATQFAAIGAGKPAEFGRFLIVPASLLAIVAAAGLAWLARRYRLLGIVAVGALIAFCGVNAYGTLAAFVRDGTDRGTRRRAAAWLRDRLRQDSDVVVGVLREPAPYCVPPIDFDRRRVLLLPETRPDPREKPLPDHIVATVDSQADTTGHWWDEHYEVAARFPPDPGRGLGRPTAISWADKPVVIWGRRATPHPESR